ncbi:antigen like protein [Clarias magur]|uniref:Antigen like protein n=1 Tax=Clarias magur TaxID=1594786 RepID=A0A8J4TY36_CLAMG|nr:antigen like protein [Clarias magur]
MRWTFAHTGNETVFHHDRLQAENPKKEQLQVDVSGPVGSTAVLPCELTSVNPKNIPNITWFNKSDTVFERSARTSNQVKRYEGRVDVPVEKRNCSLVLHNLTLSDTGVYTSYQAVMQ